MNEKIRNKARSIAATANSLANNNGLGGVWQALALMQLDINAIRAEIERAETILPDEPQSDHPSAASECAK